MLPLFDMLKNAQNGSGIDALAKQFGLSSGQAQAAVDALLPAFSQGLKRNASDPYGIAALLTAMAGGQHAKYFEDASKAFTPEGVQEGNGILGHLFGSKDLSRAVASQAAQATGIGQDVLKQMMPAIAAMLMGGLSKQSTGQLQAGGFGTGGNPLGEIIEQMMRQAGGAAAGPASQQPQAPDPANPFDNPFGKILQDMFGGGAAGQQPQGQPAPGNASGDNPLGKMLEDMLRQAQQQPQAQPETSNANPSGNNPYGDILGKMFETGRQQQDDYQKGVESIFDQFAKGLDRYR